MSQLAQRIRDIRHEAPAKRAEILERVNSIIITGIETNMYNHFKNCTLTPYSWKYDPSAFSEILTEIKAENIPLTPHDVEEYNVLLNRIFAYFCAPDYKVHTDSTSFPHAKLGSVFPPGATWHFEIVDNPQW